MSDLSAEPKAIWALVPVKAFSLAKSRLAGLLGPEERAAFARALFEHVLGVLGEVPELAGTLVVTSCAEVGALGRARGALVAADAVPEGLGLIVDAGLHELAARGAGGALVLMSDLPRLAAGDLRRLLAMMREHAVVVAPDERGAGTNALGLDLGAPDRPATSFGRADSFEQHRSRARARGLGVGVHRSPGLGFDIDDPEDLIRLWRDGGRWGSGPATNRR